MGMLETCNHRNCALVKLVLLIKMASKTENTGMSEDDILKVGLESLATIGASGEELTVATMELLFDT
jgi:hypothetical protein